jgi:purine-nucleoside phosphorylase
MSTHIAAGAGAVAPVVLMPGDPLRARWIAREFLTDAACFNEVRGMDGWTGSWQGHRVSVHGSGMGQPSLAIYATELVREHGARTLIRVGSCGALTERLRLRDLVIATGACTDSSMNRIRFEGMDYAPVADFALARAAYDAAVRLAGESSVHTGPVFSSDSFYHPRTDVVRRMAQHGVLAVEMEASALYTIAAGHGVRALAVNTVSDHVLTGEELSAQERQESFVTMIEVALAAAFGDA